MNIVLYECCYCCHLYMGEVSSCDCLPEGKISMFNKEVLYPYGDIKDLEAVVKDAIKLIFHYKGEILDIDHANRFEDFAYSVLHKVGKHE